MIAEGVERGRRHGIDGVGTDQLLDIEYVAIVLVLGAGGGPQQSLRPCAPGREPVPARAGKQPLVFLIGELGVGDRHLALQRGQPFLLARVIGLCDPLIELLVHSAVDAADEKACDARDMGRVAAARDIFFQPGKIGLGNLDIDLLRKQQRDVDADALGDQMLDRRQALRGRRHLDHQIFAIDFVPEPLGLGNRGLGVRGQIGRHFEADEAVMAVEMVIDRPQHVRRMLDVLDREMFEQFRNRAIAAFQRLTDRAVIFVRAGDRLFEDRGVRGDALDAVGIDQLLQIALGDKAAGQEIQPDGLAVTFECFDGVHDACFCAGCSMGGFRNFSGGRSLLTMSVEGRGRDKDFD